MDCSEALISEDPEARTHREGCADCRARQQVWEALDAPLPPMSPTFAAATAARLRAATAGRGIVPLQRRRWPRQVAGWGLAAAAGFALAHSFQQHREPAAPVVAVAPAPAAPTPVAPTPLPEPLSAFVRDGVPNDGNRLRAIDLVDRYFPDAGTNPPGVLVKALVRTLRSDRNPGVRKRAAEALQRFHSTPEIRDAFIAALRRDSNPAIRIIAIEALAEGARALDPTSIESLRERAGDHEENQHLRTVAARALGTISM
jgi:hypothetical protein